MEYLPFVALFFALLAIRVPIAFVIFAVSIGIVLRNPAIIEAVHVQRVIEGTQPFPLLAIPLFILVGSLANISGISRRVLDFAAVLTRSARGGLAQTNVVMSAAMSGMSGSGIGDAAMQSKMLVPEMVRRGYPLGFASALTAASALIAPMIPPGLGLILFGFVTDISIGRLFLGGIVPGLLMTAVLMIYVRFAAHRKGFEPAAARAPAGTIARATMRAAPVLFLPVIIIGGIRGGVFTPSESAGVAVAYAALLCLVYRECSLRDFFEALRSASVTTAMIMLVVAASAGLGWILTFEQVPQNVGRAMLMLTDEPIVMLAIIGALLFVCGIFMDGTPLILIFGPMFLPVVNALEIDPIQYGVYFVLIVHLGGITPPVGGLMFAVCAVTGVSVASFARAVVPFVLCILSVAAMLAVFPPLTTWLAYR